MYKIISTFLTCNLIQPYIKYVIIYQSNPLKVNTAQVRMYIKFPYAHCNSVVSLPIRGVVVVALANSAKVLVTSSGPDDKSSG